MPRCKGGQSGFWSDVCPSFFESSGQIRLTNKEKTCCREECRDGYKRARTANRAVSGSGNLQYVRSGMARRDYCFCASYQLLPAVLSPLSVLYCDIQYSETPLMRTMEEQMRVDIPNGFPRRVCAQRSQMAKYEIFIKTINSQINDNILTKKNFQLYN